MSKWLRDYDDTRAAGPFDLDAATYADTTNGAPEIPSDGLITLERKCSEIRTQ